MSSTLLKIAIIGEGVIGVSTALAIRQALPKAVIKIFSDRPFEDTTSFGPAGIFRFNEDRYKSWAEKTFNFWAKLEREESPLNTGESLEKLEKAFGSIVYNFRWLTQRELSLISYAAEGRRFVSYLKNQLGNTVEYKTQKIESIKELANQDFSLIVNCAGLGGGKLAGDDENVFPNRGVGIVVKAPGQSHFCYEDADTFCIPVVGDDRVLLGTLRQDNRWDREISREDINDIWTRVTELKPSLKHSEVVSEWCGLRPDRKGGVRLEHKLLEDDKTNKQIHVIHNYGHGAKGFLLSWGCAREVLELIKNKGICE
uniref:FAD dependent oxidoreductase domain-containing protein n=1 Tax=Meloidogyne incognita TaxID=6306 RepID=A0A914MJH2_MELIC